MPEGDTVALTARRLDAALAGRVLTGCDLRVPALATADLSGREVVGVASVGKHLLARVASRADDPVPGGLTLHSHLRMDGSWHLYRPGARWRGPAHQVRAVLTTADRVAVGFRLPVLELLPTAEEHRVVGHLGPDLLDPDADLAAAARRLVERPDRPIGVVLLDQRVMAGVGNLYRVEVLFLHGLHPWRPVGSVPDPVAVVTTAARLLRLNRDRPEQVTTGENAPGRRTYVFERAGRPCRRCGSPVRQARQGPPGRERVTYWCPVCQPAATDVSPDGGT